VLTLSSARASPQSQALGPSKGHAGRAATAFATWSAQAELLVELDVKRRGRNFHSPGLHRYRGKQEKQVRKRVCLCRAAPLPFALELSSSTQPKEGKGSAQPLLGQGSGRIFPYWWVLGAKASPAWSAPEHFSFVKVRKHDSPSPSLPDGRIWSLLGSVSDLLVLFPSLTCYPPSFYFAFFFPILPSLLLPCPIFLHHAHLHHPSLLDQVLLLFLISPSPHPGPFYISSRGIPGSHHCPDHICSTLSPAQCVPASSSLPAQTNPNGVDVWQPAFTAQSLCRKGQPGRSMPTRCSRTLPSLPRSPRHCRRYTTGLRAGEERPSARADKQLQGLELLPPRCCTQWYCKAQEELEASLLSSHPLTARYKNNFSSLFAWMTHRSSPFSSWMATNGH